MYGAILSGDDHTPTMTTDHDPLSEDELFEVLGSSRRRLLLSDLADSDGSVSLREASRTIVAHEADVAREDAAEGSAVSVCASLRRTHVPVLEAHDVVEYDDAERVVSPGERSDEVLPALRDGGSKGTRRRLAAGYLAVAAGLVSVVLANALRPTAVPDAVVAAATVGAVTILVGGALGRHYGTGGVGPEIVDGLLP